ncbi:MAG: pyrroline-5-carboxylate reductase [Candidatus Omnitrophota bacterium]
MKKIGIIGYGNMGSAIAERIKTEYNVLVFDKDKSKKPGKGIIFSATVVDLVEKSDVLILAVKPQDFDACLAEIKSCPHLGDKLFISIAAGITTAHIEKVLGVVRVVRAMPNLPAKIGQGVTCLAKGKFASLQDFEFADDIFEYMGEIMEIDESMMSAATAVSGSGPGFLCDLVDGKTSEEMERFAEKVFVPTLTASANSLGFTASQSAILASSTSAGTISIIKVMHVSPEELKKQVTSKKGTTEAGLKELKHDINNLDAAVKAAKKRAEELSKG